MAFGGGLYTEQNKVLPGAYHKFSSENTNTTVYAERGLVGLITPTDWSNGELTRLVVPALEVEHEGAYVWPRDAVKVLGYSATVDVPERYTGAADLAKFVPVFVREVFRHAVGCFIYPLLGSNKAKASCTLCTAKKYGERGNKLALTVTELPENHFTVTTLLDGVAVDEQMVAKYDELVDNDFVAFDKSGTLSATASMALSGGLAGTVDVADIELAVERLGSYGVNIVCPMHKLTDTKVLNAVITQNEKYGHWMQMIGEHTGELVPTGGSEYLIAPDVANDSINLMLLFPYLAGAEAACELRTEIANRSLDSELLRYLVDKEGMKPPTQEQLEHGIRAGYMMLHTVGNDWRVLNDDNTYIKYTPTKDKNFHKNQVVRVLFTMANDRTGIFVNEFANKAGTRELDRNAYKMRLVKSAQYFYSIGALAEFDTADITVEAGAQSDAYYVKAFTRPNLAVNKVYHDTVVAAFRG